MNEDQKALRDVLGIYYDSSEVKMGEVPDTISMRLTAAMHITDTGSLIYDFEAICGDKKTKCQSGKNSYSTDVLPEVLNVFCPNFYVNEECSSTSLETFQFTVKEAGKSDLNFTETHLRIQKLIKQLCSRDGHAPITFNLDVLIKRNTSPTHRDAFANKKRSDALQQHAGRYGQAVTTINEYFAAVCSPERGSPNYVSWRGNTDFKGAIKRTISNKDKRVAIFLIEFLWGNKITLATKVSEVWDKLAMLSYNDFGIKDVVRMRDFMSALNSGYTIKDLNKSLTSSPVNLKPKGVLKRWQKTLNPLPNVSVSK